MRIQRPGGFSLTELLIVMVIIGILAAVTLPAIGRTLRATRLTQGTQMVLDQIHLARQHAATKNRVVELRFYRYSGETDWRRLQSYELLSDGTSKALSRITTLPDGVYFLEGSSFSPLLQASRIRHWSGSDAQPSLPGVNTSYDTRSMLFYPDGTTDLPADGGHWFISAVVDREATGLPANFSMIQINPWTGHTQLYRP